MTTKNKYIIGLAAAGVAAYLVFKPKAYANVQGNAKQKLFWDREAHVKFWKRLFNVK
jgi:hypothetical protein